PPEPDNQGAGDSLPPPPRDHAKERGEEEPEEPGDRSGDKTGLVEPRDTVSGKTEGSVEGRDTGLEERGGEVSEGVGSSHRTVEERQLPETEGERALSIDDIVRMSDDPEALEEYTFLEAFRELTEGGAPFTARELHEALANDFGVEMTDAELQAAVGEAQLAMAAEYANSKQQRMWVKVSGDPPRYAFAYVQSVILRPGPIEPIIISGSRRRTATAPAPAAAAPVSWGKIAPVSVSVSVNLNPKVSLPPPPADLYADTKAQPTPLPSVAVVFNEASQLTGKRREEIIGTLALVRHEGHQLGEKRATKLVEAAIRDGLLEKIPDRGRKLWRPHTAEPDSPEEDI